jgi:type VI secretion system secreted protein VgrG
MTLLSAISSPNLALTVASGATLDIRTFDVTERIAGLFEVALTAVSEDPDIDFEAILGQAARFAMYTGAFERVWSGICVRARQTRVEADGLSTYELTVAPKLWLLTQRRNTRVFQHLTEPDIARSLLREWGIDPEVRLGSTYKARECRVQYGESDYAFFARMLEGAGISMFFEQHGDETMLVLSDAPHASKPRTPSLPFRDDVSMVRGEYATRPRVERTVRPGRYTVRDRDYRLPAAYPLMASAEAEDVLDVEGRLERFHYVPGVFLAASDRGDGTPVADDRGKIRSDEAGALELARRRLAAKRATGRALAFESNAYDLHPGMVVSIDGHPRVEMGGKWLIVETKLSGARDEDWTLQCEARSAEVPYCPPLATPRPRALGVESATVVGPPGEEIHVDEFGRVCCHFHWDRESLMNERSSCWIPVSQPWGGAGYGMINLPRVGQEVLVAFLGGDPDRPVIVGRVHTATQPVPYSLPESKTVSSWRSESTPGGGGYNEIKFEDQKGAEVFSMQAERDMQKLVKRDMAVTVGRDRAETVERNEVVMVGQNRTTMIQNNAREVVGLSRTRVVGVNECVDVGANQQITVCGEQAESVGLGKAVSVGTSYNVTTGGPVSISANGSATVISAEKIVLACGASSIVIEPGKITLSSPEIAVQSSGPASMSGTTVSVAGKTIAVNASGAVEVGGASVHLSGDPVDLN